MRAVEELDWTRIDAELDAGGHALTGPMLDVPACTALAALYRQEAPFRSRVAMERHGFGKGEYKCFNHPLPDAIRNLRAPIYRRLASIADRWAAAMGIDTRFPAEHAEFLDRCHVAL